MKYELPFTLILILACLFAYGAALIPIPSVSDVLNAVSFVIALGLFVTIVASSGQKVGTK